MKLRVLSPPSWRISVSLAKWARRLEISKIALTTKPEPVRGVIAVMNSFPDNVVCLILAHRLNGKITVGITKPSKSLGISAIPEILRSIKDVEAKGLAVILDQEAEPLESIWDRVEQALREVVECKCVECEQRFHAYKCLHPTTGHQLTVAVAVNGLEGSYAKHTIEDHLLELSKNIISVEEVEKLMESCRGDPKRAWRSLGEKRQEVLFHMLEIEETALEQLFPQQMKALKIFIG